jgi:hypothetical protein
MFTLCSLNVHFMFTECSLNVTKCSLNVHWMFTECSLNEFLRTHSPCVLQRPFVVVWMCSGSAWFGLVCQTLLQPIRTTCVWSTKKTSSDPTSLISLTGHQTSVMTAFKFGMVLNSLSISTATYQNFMSIVDEKNEQQSNYTFVSYSTNSRFECVQVWRGSE